MSKPTDIKQFVVNAMTRGLCSIMPGLFGSDTKHRDFYNDYGYPHAIDFAMYHNMWERNGYATAGVNHAIETCWQDFPFLVEREETHDKTVLEKELITQLERLQFWSKLSEVDKYSRVGEYSGAIFRFRDDKAFDQPVDRVVGGLDGIAEIIPAWQGQLIPIEFDTVEASETYGSVTMYQ